MGLKHRNAIRAATSAANFSTGLTRFCSWIWLDFDKRTVEESVQVTVN